MGIYRALQLKQKSINLRIAFASSSGGRSDGERALIKMAQAERATKRLRCKTSCSSIAPPSNTALRQAQEPQDAGPWLDTLATTLQHFRRAQTKMFSGMRVVRRSCGSNTAKKLHGILVSRRQQDRAPRANSCATHALDEAARAFIAALEATDGGLQGLAQLRKLLQRKDVRPLVRDPAVAAKRLKKKSAARQTASKNRCAWALERRNFALRLARQELGITGFAPIIQGSALHHMMASIQRRPHFEDLCQEWVRNKAKKETQTRKKFTSKPDSTSQSL